ncbi:MAG: hypothetical protein IJZ55_00240 [Lachnospiraceae bacterium]|nr:hypothetical protein [Lachnospiraceae bacterium]
MNKYKLAKELTKQFYSDKKTHTVQETRAFLRNKNIDVDTDPNTTNNIIFLLKKEGYLKKCNGIGIYQLAINIPKTSTNRIDYNKYITITPDQKQYPKKLVVNRNGVVRLNSTFLKCESLKKFDILFDPANKSILLIPNEDSLLCFTKSGILKNVGFENILKKNHVSIPATFILTQDKDLDAWKGTLEKQVSTTRQ